MDKLKKEIKVEPIKSILGKYNGQEFLIEPFITFEHGNMLYTTYVETYFDEESSMVERKINADISFVLAITDLCTTIDIEKIKDIDGFVYGGLWKEIYSNIANYDEYVKNINILIERIENQNAIEKSIGSVIDNLGNKLMNFIENVDLSTENIDKLINELSDSKKDFEKRLPDVFNNKEE